MKEFKKTILEYDTVLECHHISGEYDYLIKVLAEDTSSLEEFISVTLKEIGGFKKLIQPLFYLQLKKNLIQ
ncbi:Lrp/AsnC ligand binding domain-containing protein [Clostridioides difficile]|uniref:Lrp/AsnC ligand binding domain-containing protein n=1 Tax=Clostridioides difficile TaxID=1496 RepID=UPI002FE6F568